MRFTKTRNTRNDDGRSTQRPQSPQNLFLTLANPRKRRNFKVLSKAEAMACFKTLLESGQLAPIIARTFPLSEVPAAMRYLQEGCVTERIVITPWSTGAR